MGCERIIDMPSGVYIRTEEHNRKNREAHTKWYKELSNEKKIELAKKNSDAQKKYWDGLGLVEKIERRRITSEFNKSRIGYKHTGETKNKISNAHLGKKLSEEHKKKISDGNKGVSKNL